MLLLNNVPINYFQFPGGELHVKLPDYIIPESCVLTWLPKDPQSIILLHLTVNALKHAGICDITLDCLYLPYARQDRVCSPGEAFSLEVICSILDSLSPLTMIRFWDTHNWRAMCNLLPNAYLFEIEYVENLILNPILRPCNLKVLCNACGITLVARLMMLDIKF